MWRKTVFAFCAAALVAPTIASGTVFIEPLIGFDDRNAMPGRFAGGVATSWEIGTTFFAVNASTSPNYEDSSYMGYGSESDRFQYFTAGGGAYFRFSDGHHAPRFGASYALFRYKVLEQDGFTSGHGEYYTSWDEKSDYVAFHHQFLVGAAWTFLLPGRSPKQPPTAARLDLRFGMGPDVTRRVGYYEATWHYESPGSNELGYEVKYIDEAPVSLAVTVNAAGRLFLTRAFGLQLRSDVSVLAARITKGDLDDRTTNGVALYGGFFIAI